MTDLRDAYSEAWFRQRAGYRAAYGHFAAAIEQVWHPQGLIDVGCGAGYVVEHFAGRTGSIPVLGVDGSAAAPAVQSEAARRCCILADLTEPPRQDLGRYEFAVSIEVAEHIPAAGAEAFMRWFAGTRRVLFTAAPPGQGGLHHVNEQPPVYWRERFAAMGLAFDEPATQLWQAEARRRTSGCPWVVRNAMFFTAERP